MQRLGKDQDIGIVERVDAHTHVPKERLSLHPPFPDAVKIEVTARCNLRCNFCAVPQHKRETGDMDEGFLYYILAQLRDVGVKEVGLFLLGESLLLPNFHQYVRRAKELGFEYVFLTTNGTLCTPDRMIPIIEAGLDSIKFSVNAGDAKTYNEMHGVDLFNQVVENIKWMGEYKHKNKLKIKTALSSIMIPAHKESLIAFHEKMKQFVDQTYFLPFYNLAGHMIGVGSYSNIEKASGNIGRYENPTKAVPCWVLFNASKITWDGWMTACYSDHDESFKIADLSSVGILDAWNSDKIVELRRQHLEGDFKPDSFCSKCLGITK